MVSLIIPTLWKHPPFVEFLKQLVEVETIGEIIIVNNSPAKTPDDPIFANPKIVMCNMEKNIYVVPAWNHGVSIAKYDKIGILEDDLEVDLRVFERVDPLLTEEAGMFNLVCDYFVQSETYREHLTDGSVNIIPDNGILIIGFGACFFLHKKNWFNVPEIKIWHGEFVLHHHQMHNKRKNYAIVNCRTKSPWHTTAHSLDEKENHLDIKISRDWKIANELIYSLYGIKNIND